MKLFLPAVILNMQTSVLRIWSQVLSRQPFILTDLFSLSCGWSLMDTSRKREKKIAVGIFSFSCPTQGHTGLMNWVAKQQDFEKH